MSHEEIMQKCTFLNIVRSILIRQWVEHLRGIQFSIVKIFIFFFVLRFYFVLRIVNDVNKWPSVERMSTNKLIKCTIDDLATVGIQPNRHHFTKKRKKEYNILSQKNEIESESFYFFEWMTIENCCTASQTDYESQLK